MPTVPNAIRKTTTAAVALALLLWLAPTSPVSAQRAPDPATGHITVTGDTLINVAPDRILCAFGVETRGLDLAIAKQQNDATVKKALAAIANMGIPERDIQTDRISVEQKYRDYNNSNELLGYIVRNMFVVTLNDPAKVEDLISRTLASGVNFLLGVDFRTTELKKYREQARELAARAAREKADKIAAVLGESVGHAITINEGYNAPDSSMYNSTWSGFGSQRTNSSQNAVAVSAGDASDTVALGKVSVRANVNVTFELKRQ
jgi:uncharacterized protein